MVKMFVVSSINCDTKITNKNNTPKRFRFCVCRSYVFASKLKFIEFVYKYNTPIPDSNPKLNVVWQNKDGGSPKVPHSQIWDLLTSRHDSSRGVVNWISCASSGALSSRPKIPEIPGGGANGTDIFWNFNSKFWVYLAKLA